MDIRTELHNLKRMVLNESHISDLAKQKIADRILQIEKGVALFSVSNSYTKEDIIKAYDDGFNDGNQRDLNPIG